MAGISIGLAIAAPIGPMAVIVIRRTLAGGFLAGITTGAGASTIHLVYATLVACGLSHIAIYAEANRKLMSVAIALVLVTCALRMIRPRSAAPGKIASSGRSLLGHYASAVAFTMVNPMLLALLLGAVAATAGFSSNGATQVSSLAAGVFAGSIAWWFGLVCATALIGVRLSPRSMRALDIAAALMLVGLAGSTMSRIL